MKHLATRKAREQPDFAHAMTKTQSCRNGRQFDGDRAETQAQAIAMQTRDFERAYRAFVAKEKPHFEGD
jgi:enoyl-CoA hydratase/carnithine racemase